jgi:ankyrin repeat protein
MEQRDSLSDKIIARIKNNPVVATLIVAGTVVIALATFSEATRHLLDLVKGQSPETARRELNSLSVDYTPQAFILRAQQGDLRAVKLFLAAGMDPNTRDAEGNTALMYAITENRADLVKVLLQAKPNVAQQNNGGGTALTWAAERGQVDTLRLLLDHRADTQAINEAFVSAAGSAQLDVLHALLERGAKLNEVGSKALLAAAGSTYVDVPDQARSDTVTFLCSLGVDVNAKDNEGWTALLLAADRNRASVVQTLTEKGADVDARCDCTGYLSGGWTALMIAAREGHNDIVRILVAKHADVSLKNNLGSTALPLAAHEGRVDVVRTLLANGADVNAKGINGRTPLMEAALGGNFEVVQTLLQQGAHVHDKDAQGRTTLQFATLADRATIIPLLKQAQSK